MCAALAGDLRKFAWENWKNGVIKVVVYKVRDACDIVLFLI